jgi:hypothetical protein
MLSKLKSGRLASLEFLFALDGKVISITPTHLSLPIAFQNIENSVALNGIQVKCRRFWSLNSWGHFPRLCGSHWAIREQRTQQHPTFCGGGQTASSKQRVSTIKPRLNSLDEKEIGHRKKRNCGQQ